MGPDEIAPLRAARQKQLLQRAEAADAAVAKVEAKKLTLTVPSASCAAVDAADSAHCAAAASGSAAAVPPHRAAGVAGAATRRAASLRCHCVS